MSRSPAILPSLDTLATRLNRTFNGRETEDNWEPLALMFRASKEAISCTSQSLLVNSFMKTVATTALEACLLSERTRLATSVMEMCRELAAHKLEASTWDLVMTQLLKVCERVNKLFVLRAKGTIEALLPSIPGKTAFGRCAEACSSPNKGLRLVAMELLTIAIKCHGEDVEDGQVVILKKVISEGLSDASGPVRDASRAAMHALIQFKPQSAREMLGKPQTSVANSAAMSVSSMSRASSSLLRTAKVVTADGQSRTILGPQRIPSGVPEAASFAAVDGVAPKRALRVASSMLVNSFSTSNLRASNRPALSSRNNPPTSTSPSSKPLERVDSRLQRLVQGRPTSRSAMHLQHASSASTSTLDVNSVKFVVADALKTGLKSTDWSARQQLVDRIASSVDASESGVSFVGRCLQVAITALSDSHVRVQQAGVALSDRLVEIYLKVFPAEAQLLMPLLEALVVRLFAVQSQLKGKHEDLARIASLLLASLDANSAISLLSNAFSRPEVIVLSRLKYSLVSLALSHISQVEAGLQDAVVCRTLFSRLGLLLDEPATSQIAAECFAKLYALNAANYYATVQQCVKSLAARKILQQTVGHIQSQSKAVMSEGKEMMMMMMMMPCVTPTRASSMTAQKTSTTRMAIFATPKAPSTCNTPSQHAATNTVQAAATTPPTNLPSLRTRTEIELTVRKRIESAIRQVMCTPLSLSAAAAAKFVDGQRASGGISVPMSVDTMVEKVRARIRVALARHQEKILQDASVDRIIDEIRSLDTPQKLPPSPNIEDEQDQIDQLVLLSPTLSRIPHSSSKNELAEPVIDDSAEVEALLEAALQQFFASSPMTNHLVSSANNNNNSIEDDDDDDEEIGEPTMRQVLDCIMSTPSIAKSNAIFIYV